MSNDKFEDLKSQFMLQLNQVKEQVNKLQTQQLELANVITTLSRVAAKLANSQQRFENFIFSFNNHEKIHRKQKNNCESKRSRNTTLRRRI